jgi:hypothetical protein
MRKITTILEKRKAVCALSNAGMLKDHPQLKQYTTIIWRATILMKKQNSLWLK